MLSRRWNAPLDGGALSRFATERCDRDPGVCLSSFVFLLLRGESKAFDALLHLNNAKLAKARHRMRPGLLVAVALSATLCRSELLGGAMPQFAKALVQRILAIEKWKHRRPALFDSAASFYQPGIWPEAFPGLVEDDYRVRALAGCDIHFGQIQVKLQFFPLKLERGFA